MNPWRIHSGVNFGTIPRGLTHGDYTMNLGSELRSFIRPRRLGRVAGSDLGVLIEHDPNTIREPDVAFISMQKLPLEFQLPGSWEGVPDNVAEIVSPSDSPQDVIDRTRMWIGSWMPQFSTIDFETRTTESDCPNQPVLKLSDNEMQDGGQVLPSFSCPVRDLFEL